MLVDIICTTSFSFKVGALRDRAEGKSVNYLVQAVDDFAKRGVLVCAICLSMILRCRL